MVAKLVDYSVETMVVLKGMKKVESTVESSDCQMELITAG
jgi:hypothetical protein